MKQHLYLPHFIYIHTNLHTLIEVNPLNMPDFLIKFEKIIQNKSVPKCNGLFLGEKNSKQTKPTERGQNHYLLRDTKN